MEDKTGAAYAVERYEAAISTQRDRREQFTQRALKLSRIVLLILGASVTGLSILIDNGQLMPVGTLAGPVALAAGGIILIVALGFAVGTSKIIRIVYSPPRPLSADRELRPPPDTLHEQYADLDPQEVIEYYELAFQFNQEQLKAPALRLERAYLALFIGTSWLIVGFVLVVLQPSAPSVTWGLLLVLGLGTYGGYLLVREEYHREFSLSDDRIGALDEELLAMRNDEPGE